MCTLLALSDESVSAMKANAGENWIEVEFDALI